MAAAAFSEARSSKPSFDYGDHLQLVGDCITMKNPITNAPSRDRSYQAIDENGDPIGATITERVFVPSADFAPNLTPMSSAVGTFHDSMGLSFLQAGVATYYQYFVTTLPGTPWVDVPTSVRTGNGDFMVFSVGVSAQWVNGTKIYNVSYNGDAGMWNPDGSPRLPLCP